MPAPTSFNSGACSWTSTSMPRLSSASAAARPPMPPPMMMILSLLGTQLSPLIPRALKARTQESRYYLRMCLWVPDSPASLGFRDDGDRFRSIERYAGCLHDIRPARDFLGDEFSEILRRADLGIEAKLAHAFLH